LRKALTTVAATLGLAFLVMLTAFAVKEIDRVLAERMAELKSKTIAALEAAAGRTITYAGIAPSIFQYLEIRDLAFHDAASSEGALLTIHNIRVYYSLARLLFGRDPVGALREVQIRNTRLSLDLDKDKDVLDLLQRLSGTGGGQAQFRARITGANVSVTLAAGDMTVSLTDLFFQIESQKDTIKVSLRGGCQGKLPEGFDFVSTLKVQGSVDRRFTSSDLTVQLLSFESSLFAARSQTLQVVWKGSSVEVRKIQDRSPVELDITADLERQQVTATFEAQDLRPDMLFSLSGRLARYENWLRAPLTASGHVTWRLPDRSLEYQLDVSAYFEDQLPVRQVTLDSSFRGSHNEAFFEPLRLSSPSGAMEFEGNLLFENLLPEGLLTLTNIDSGTGERVSAELSLQRHEGRLDVLGSRLEFGELSFDELALLITPLRDGLSFSLSTSFEGAKPGDLVQASGDLHFGQPIYKVITEGSAGSIGAPTVSLSGMLRNIPPAKLYQLLSGAGALPRAQKDLYGVLARFSVSADVIFTTDFRSFSATSHEVTITQLDEPGTLLRFGLVVDTTHLALTDFTGTWKGLNVKGGFDGHIAPGGQIAFGSNLLFMGTPYSITGRYSPTQGLQATGSYGLGISVVPLREGVLSVQLKGERFPLPLSPRPIIVSFGIAGLLTPEGEWSADFPSITVFDVPFLESTTNTIQLSGKLTPRRLEVTRLSFVDAFSAIEGNASADIALPDDPFDPSFLQSLSAQGSVTLKSPGNAESYTAKGGLNQGSLSFTIRFTGSPLARIGKSAVKGALSGTSTISGPVQRPAADISVTLSEGRLGTDNLSLSGQVNLVTDVVRVSALSIGYLSHNVSQGAGTVNLKDGTFSFTARYQGEYFLDQVRLSAGLDGQFAPARLGSLLQRLFDQGLQGKLALNEITVAAAPFPSWSIGFRTDAGRLTFDGGPSSSLHGWIDSQLSFSMILKKPLPISGTAVGRIVGDRISSTLDVESLDLLVLNSVLKSPPIQTPTGPLPIIRVTSGVATGRLIVDGPVNDPDYTGRLELVGGGVASAYLPDEAGPIRTTLTFDGKTFHSPKTIAKAGSARLSAEATFTIDHWSPVGFDISIGTVGEAPAHMSARFGRLIADGSASGQVRIAGDDRKTNVTGDLQVNDCRIALGEASSGKFIPEEVPTFVTLTVETGRRVEFFWPSENLPVLRATASPGGRIAITYRGDTGAYTVKGTASVQGGEIYYFERSFIVKKGSIIFNEDQNNFDPHVTANAEVREWDPYTGEEVKIHLDADSTLSKFSPRFSSDPARTETAILAMIGAPILTRTESQGPVMAAALVYTDILSQTWILRPFEQKVRQLLNLDMFSIRTQLLQNLVAERIFGSTLNPLDNTSVSLGKYVGNDLFWEMLVRLQSPPLPTGAAPPPGSLQYGQFQTGVSAPYGGLPIGGTGLQPELELSIEWATPLFLLTWSWVPQHPESLFLVDNSLAFSWRISY
jgi:translocation and assembly module TamB